STSPRATTSSNASSVATTHSSGTDPNPAFAPGRVQMITDSGVGSKDATPHGKGPGSSSPRRAQAAGDEPDAIPTATSAPAPLSSDRRSTSGMGRHRRGGQAPQSHHHL